MILKKPFLPSRRGPCVVFSMYLKNKIMDFDEACFMHLTPEVVHNFPKAVGV